MNLHYVFGKLYLFALLTLSLALVQPGYREPNRYENPYNENRFPFPQIQPTQYYRPQPVYPVTDYRTYGAVCPIPPAVLHGRYSNSDRKVYRENEQVVYSCDYGYHLSGPKVLTCRYRSWGPETPKCRAPLVSHCRSIMSPIHGNFYGRKRLYSDDDVVEFFCNPEYTMVGPSELRCYAGSWDGSEPQCEAKDACATWTCNRKYEYCRVQYGKAQCDCQTGYVRGTGGECIPRDPCSDYTCYNTLQHCVNTYGQAKCVCKTGYRESGLNQCIQIDPCEYHDCPEYSRCVVADGFKASCVCLGGYRQHGDGKCIKACDHHECHKQYGKCIPTSDGQYRCQCNVGYDGDGRTCTQKNPCHNKNCPRYSRCISSGYDASCVCINGYRKHTDGSCVEPCEYNTCHQHAQCYPLPDHNYNCKCNEGYQGDGRSCALRDPCLSKICPPYSACRASGYAAQCDCISTYRQHTDGRCVKACDYHTCHRNARCYPKPGQSDYVCKCGTGYEGDGRSCRPRNPCHSKICRPFSTCQSSGYKATCKCIRGYRSHTDGSCVKPCDYNTCHQRAKCYPRSEKYRDTYENHDTYDCRCETGYAGDGKTCIQINPCDVKICPLFSKCRASGYQATCECIHGYTRHNDGKCVKPCTYHTCHEHAQCYPKIGGDYYCKCGDRYDGDGRDCKPRDPCFAKTCPEYSECRVVPRTYIPLCVCSAGYKRHTDGKCVKPCEYHTCHEHANCYPRDDGDYDCKCRERYGGDGKSCKPINPCDSYDCKGPYSRCQVNGYKAECVCRLGYKRHSDGKCVRPCEYNDCHGNARCYPTQSGRYNCRCNDGYDGDGKYCNMKDPCDRKDCPEYSECRLLLETRTAVCRCSNGYRQHSDGRCVKPCEYHTCHEHANCYPRDNGNYDCKCRERYGGDGKNCKPINPCDSYDCKGPYSRCQVNGYKAECVCRQGYKRHSDGKCVQPCEYNECHRDARCFPQHSGLYNCKCNDGYDGDGKSCTMRDPCDLKNCPEYSECQLLLKTRTAVCRCSNGYRQHSDGRCVKPCEYHTCHEHANCYPRNDGNYDCKCRERYGGDGKNCKPINPCDSYDCQGPYSRCQVKNYKAECICRQGYRKHTDGKCVQPCEYNTCHGDARCHPMLSGQYNCKCNDGYSGDGKACIARDPCHSFKCSENSICQVLPTTRTAVCVCKRGYRRHTDGGCIEPCDHHTCHEHAQCYPRNDGNYDCKCTDRYNGDGKSCILRDACLTMECPPHSKCVASGNAAKCMCLPGYRKHTDETCIRACEFHKCARDAKCIPKPDGNYHCRCNSRYEGDGRVCRPKNPCNSLNCKPHSRCILLPTGFEAKCICGEGYRTHTDGSCIESCEYNDCSEYAECRPSTEGKYTCVCRDGYHGDGASCNQVFPCSRNPCNQYADCIDLDAEKYRCDCHEGYTGDGKNDCRPVIKPPPPPLNTSPCATLPCHEHASCTDIGPENFRCDCIEGFEGDGKKECKSIALPCDIHPCHPKAICKNLGLRKFDCTCIRGFKGNGKQCTAVKSRCKLPPQPKNGNFAPARLFLPIGKSVTYTCLYGYHIKGNPVRKCKVATQFERSLCIDNNECENTPHPCDVNADCLNIPGSYLCSCKEGYTGDGKICQTNGCPMPPKPDYGYVEPRGIQRIAVNDPAIYVCEEGYELRGQSQRICQNDGNYATDAPTCVRPFFCDKPDIPKPYYGRYSDEKDKYFTGEIINFKCNDGYQMVGNLKTMECGQERQWIGSVPICKQDDNRRSCKNRCGKYGGGTCMCHPTCEDLQACCDDYATYCNNSYRLQG